MSIFVNGIEEIVSFLRFGQISLHQDKVFSRFTHYARRIKREETIRTSRPKPILTLLPTTATFSCIPFGFSADEQKPRVSTVRS